jgi:iron(III) transport system permease protein
MSVSMSAPARPPAGSMSKEARLVLLTSLLVIVGFLVVYPMLSLLVTSFQANEFGRDTIWGLDNWRRVFTQDRIERAIWNTVTLSVTRQAISIVLGVLIAWLIARSNLPGRKWMEVGFWIALFMPALPVTLGWVFLIAGRSGLLNKALAELPFVDGPVFNAYSWWGIVWVHLMTATLAVKVFLLVPAFKAMDSSLEEAARASGATLWGTVRKIVVPIMMPTILVVLLIGMVRAMQAFEVELILGAPRNIDVYSTIIFRSMTQEPPQHGIASALSITFFMSIIPLVLIQQWYSNRHQYSVISGKFQHRTQDLGAWKIPIAALIWLLLFMMTVVPFVCLLMATFMKLFGMFDMANPWTTDHWVNALARGDIPRSLWNSLRLGFISAICGMVAFTAIAYVTTKTQFWGRKALDFFTWMPTLIPGLVLSLGLLQMFTGVWVFRPLYGTVAVLVLAILISTVTIGTQMIRGSIRALGRELEEAGWAAGGSRFYTFRRVMLPLIAPTVAVIGLEIFATANSAVGIIALLGTGSTQPLAILQLVLLDSGKFESGAVVGVVIMTLTIASALLARYIGNRAGLGRHA